MKKLGIGVRFSSFSFLFLIVLILLININLISAISVGDVAYIYKSTNRIDNNILDVFDDLGLDVDLIQENNLPDDFSDYKLIFVGDENFRNEDDIPVNDQSSVIANYYFGREWGLVNSRISQLGSNRPLQVLIDETEEVFPVYTKGLFRVGNTIAIPYYYLAETRIAPDFEKIATTYNTGNTHSILGGVVAYALEGAELANGKTAGGNICFYGIIESDFWTNDARELLEDCILFAIEDVVECTTDSDCDDGDKDTDDVCENPGEIDSFCTNEPIECFNDNDCDDNDDGTEDSCENPGTGDSFCANEDIICDNDIDCGVDGFVNSPFCTNDDVYQDFIEFTCDDPGTGDSSCSQTIEQRLIEMCVDICVNGICEDVTCFDDNDCDDSDPDTEDVCENPGTSGSFCTNEDIECNSNSDCGTDGLVGGLFCTGDDVYQDFRTHTCNNAGTAASICSFIDSPSLIEMCVDICVNGICEDIECFDDGDCDDNDINTEDVCNNAGLTSSFCTNDPITCFTDLECGTDGLTGSTFCSNGDVYQNFRTFMCDDPGIAMSSCSEDNQNQLVETCSFGCTNGVCDSGEHDVGLAPDYDGFGHSIRLRDENNTIIEEDVPILECSGIDYDVQFRTENNGDFTEDVDINFQIRQGTDIIFEETNTKTDLDPGATTTTGNKNNKDIFEDFGISVDGFYEIVVELIIDGFSDDNPGDNIATRDIEIVSCAECSIDADCLSGEICDNGVCVPIACFNDSDCGTDGLVGGLFCTGDDVYQDFRTFTCNLPGTAGSSCSSVDTPTLIEMCVDICVNGVCEDVECFNDSDCDDSDPDTEDICNLPGTINSFCTNDPISCSDDSDCGTDGLIGGLFCTGDDVYQDFRTHTCNLPGTAGSSCSSLDTPTLIETCSFSCSSGVCLPDPNCVDQDFYRSPTDPKGVIKTVTVPCDGEITMNFFDDNVFVRLQEPGATDKQMLMACDNEAHRYYCGAGTNCCFSSIPQHGAIMCTRDNTPIVSLYAGGGLGCPGNKIDNYPVAVNGGDVLEIFNSVWAAGEGFVTFSPL